MMQALEKADEAKNAADKSVEIISTTMTTIDDIFGQIGEYICWHIVAMKCTGNLQTNIYVPEGAEYT